MKIKSNRNEQSQNKQRNLIREDMWPIPVVREAIQDPNCTRYKYQQRSDGFEIDQF